MRKKIKSGEISNFFVFLSEIKDKSKPLRLRLIFSKHMKERSTSATLKPHSRFYKWWYLITYSFKQSNIRFLPYLLLNLGSVLDFIIVLYLWQLIDPTKERITYFFVGYMFQRLIWSQYMNNFGMEIISGKIVNRLLVPFPIFGFWFAREIGSSVLRNIVSAFLILLFIPFFIGLLQFPSLQFILMIPLLVILAFVIDFCFSYIIGSLAFWNEDFRPVGYIFGIAVKVLSGLAIPFSYFSPELQKIMIYNPYAFVTHHPMQIYLGMYSSNQVLYFAFISILWCIVLYYVSQWVFSQGLKRNESVGL